MDWTPKKNARLLDLWPDYSASEIAGMLGVTRNAVIGRYHRLRGDYKGYVSPKEQEKRRLLQDKERQSRIREQRAVSEALQKIAEGGSRNSVIAEAVRLCARMRVIGAAVGVTHQRVQQIVVAESVGQR